MFLDASSIIAMLGDEAEGDAFADALAGARIRLTSPLAIWETVASLVRQYALSVPEARAKVRDFMATAKVDMVPIGENELTVALDAYDQFGKGRHPARLNMGDCFAYAAAKCNRTPMLHKDDGFYLTDVASALAKR
jgi:ribonuclease VapC